ncbi:MAG: hypothetical protein K0S33_4134 [Bacteroidetes bacterium]|jgi:hypothetical protein|nr:hypothetical protein [Bacteroidota bacterium]
MIGIRECALNIDTIKDQHVSFVGDNMKRTIEFYIEIFKLMKRVQKKKIKLEDINTDIKFIKINTNRKDYRSLLEVFLKKGKGTKIANENQAYKIKYPNYWVNDIKNLKKIIDSLVLLSTEYESIIKINFEKNPIATFRWYKALTVQYSIIQFLVPKIFDYESWFADLDPKAPWGPYQLTNALNLNSCPYCNRQYTYTVTSLAGNKLARPELDHFLSKKTHPLLALSFFNLIPSCHVCNSSVKGSKPITYLTHLNPYEINSKHSLMRFTYFPKTYEGSVGLTNEVEIEVKYNNDPLNLKLKAKVEGNIELFCLNELYKNHSDSVQEIIRKRTISGDDYIATLQSTFKDFPIKIEDAYRLAFGNYYLEEEFSKRTLSKLTKDIAIELGTLIKF